MRGTVSKRLRRRAAELADHEVKPLLPGGYSRRFHPMSARGLYQSVKRVYARRGR